MPKLKIRSLYLAAGFLWVVAVYVLATVLSWLGVWQTGSLPSLYSMPSVSTRPSLAPGDYFLAWRNYYRDHEPKPGDLVIFKLPKDNETDYIKRLIGLPGDRIQVRGGILHINREPVHRELLAPDDAAYYVERSSVAKLYMETLPNGRRYLIRELGDDRHYDNTREYVVPPDHFFFLGDNRDQSEDSRATVGFVPRANLRDLPAFIIWSRDWGRIGTSIQPLP